MSSESPKTVQSPRMAVPPTPILHTSPAPSAVQHPQFAELLTPAKLRSKRRRQDPIGTAIGFPLAGPSRLGYTTAEGDLYIGALRDPTAAPRTDEDAITIASTDSTSSSWSWGSGNLERGRRATMAVIERFGEAIGVRRGSSSSSASSSSSSSSDDTHSQTSGRRRRLSRLTRTLSRATRTESPERPKRQYVQAKREFVLLLPKQGANTHTHDTASLASGTTSSSASERVITSPNLAMILEHIRAARTSLGVSNLPAEPISRPSSSSGRPRMRSGHHSFTAPPVPVRPMAARARTRIEALKGESAPIKPKSPAELLGMIAPTTSASSTSLSAMAVNDPPPAYENVSVERAKFKNCWWLDVSCPSWMDLKDIGELLGLHPLTLEDVLQKDPREKLETFDKLGYYFLAVRALDESYFKYTPGTQPAVPETAVNEPKEGRRRGWGMGRATGKAASKTGEKVEIIEDRPGKEGLEGVGVGGVNVYLAVFADGVVSFHFDDISKHTKRVLERALSLGEDHGADWVAHGILDSIVDAFFPLTGYVDGAVDDIDSLTIDPSRDPQQPATSTTSSPSLDGNGSSTASSVVTDEYEMSEKSRDEKGNEHWYVPKLRSGVKLSKSKQPVKPKREKFKTPLAMTYLKLFFLPTISATKHKHEEQGKAVFDRLTMLRKIHEMRRLVTGLTRLLGGKHQVVMSLRKRAAESGADVDAYLGDVQDHILLLQTSLYHYEYILAHCQPAYMSYLSVSTAMSRGGTDKAILALSTVSIAIMPMMVSIGLFSMNIHIPNNGEMASPHTEPDGSMSPFNWFAGIVVFIFIVGCFMVLTVRYWRWNARVKFSKIRGIDLPPTWDGFWGWS